MEERSQHVQADVAAINWRKRAILVGECKWSTERMDRQISHDFIEGKASLVLRDVSEARPRLDGLLCLRTGWFTDDARAFMEAHQGIGVDLEMLSLGLP